jgi:hypothetical protein
MDEFITDEALQVALTGQGLLDERWEDELAYFRSRLNKVN